MANNKFIDRMLLKLSLVNPRLRCPLTKLHIQIEMQYSRCQSLIQHFLILQPEYRYHWNVLTNTNHIRCYNLIQMPIFKELQNYLTGQQLLTFDEADWLEDTIHEILVYDD